jgi:hypothetical protein
MDQELAARLAKLYNATRRYFIDPPTLEPPPA